MIESRTTTAATATATTTTNQAAHPPITAFWPQARHHPPPYILNPHHHQLHHQHPHHLNHQLHHHKQQQIGQHRSIVCHYPYAAAAQQQQPAMNGNETLKKTTSKSVPLSKVAASKKDNKPPTMVGAGPTAYKNNNTKNKMNVYTVRNTMGNIKVRKSSSSGYTKVATVGLSKQQIAENEKWKSIRAQVLGIFDAARKRRNNIARRMREPVESENEKVTKDNNDPLIKKIFDKDVLRGITVRPSGKFQAQLYFGGRSRYIGVFDTQHEAASAYEMIREKIKNEKCKEAPVFPPISSLPSLSSSSSSGSSSSSLKQLIFVATSLSESKNAAKSTDKTTTLRSITPSPTPRGDGR
mmetsp:Transcript_10089/g.20214  ORF Transcript_10089/g.20214 Transcript_10089/m.20214 type:complete len:353 (+) Transcript_10089:1-1059(+)